MIAVKKTSKTPDTDQLAIKPVNQGCITCGRSA